MKIYLSLLLTLVTLPLSAQINAQWTGFGGQDWNVANSWTSLAVPCNSGADTYNIFIGGGAGITNMPTSCTIENFEMQLGATVTMENGVSLTVHGTATNNGLISPTSNGSNTGPFISDNSGDLKVLLTGSGVLRLDHAQDRISGTTNHILVHDSSHSITGYGNIGGSAINIENEGTIVADSSGNTLHLLPRSTFEHRGFLLASDGGILQFNGQTYTALPGSTIQVNDNSEIHLNGPTVIGEFFEAGDSDLNLTNNIVRVTSGSTLRGTDNQAHIIIDNGLSLIIDKDDFSNDGIITPQSSGFSTGLQFQDFSDLSIALGGIGRVDLNHALDRISGTTNHTLVHNSPHLIQGGGNIGATAINIVNRSTITANSAVPLNLSPRSTWLNDGGKVLVTGGATAIANSGTFTSQGGGFFQIGDGSELTLMGTTIIDSELKPDDLDLDLSNNLVRVATNSILNNCVNNSNLRLENGTTLSLFTGDFTNNATVHLDGSANATALSFSDSSDLEIQLLGTGTVFLDNNFDRITGTTNHVLRHGQDHTIEGFGGVGATTVRMINHGLIEANVTGETLTLSPRTDFHNDGGTVQTTNGGTIRFDSATYTTADGGTYLTGDNSLTELNGGTYRDLTFEINDVDLTPINNDLNVLTNTIFDGVTNEADLGVGNSRTLSLVNGDFINNAELRLNSTGAVTALSFTGGAGLNIALLGTGTVFLDSPLDRITGSTNHLLTVGPDQTIEGFGGIGASTLRLINRGLIEANVPAETMELFPRTSFLNEGGQVHARNGGTVAFGNATYTTAGGNYRIFDGSEFTLSGGTYDMVEFAVDNSDTNLGNNLVTILANTSFSDVTNRAAVRVDNARTLTISNGDLVNTGTVTLDSTGSATRISISDASDFAVQIGGAGRIFLDESTEGITGSTNHALVHDTNHTIEGAGNIGFGTIHLVNHGTLSANLSGQTLILDDRSGGFPNTGTMQALNGGILDIRDLLSHQDGLLFVESASTATSSSSISQSGGIIRVDGDLTSTGLTLTGGTLQGVGDVSGLVTASTALISPGNSTGTLTLNNGANLNNGAALQIEINATADADQLVVSSGNFAISGGALQLVYTGGPTDVSSSDVFTIVNVLGGTAVNQFINAPHEQRLTTIDGSASFKVNYSTPIASQITLTDFIYNPGGATNLDPVFVTSTTTYNVVENSASGTTLATFSAYDPEGALLTYSLTPGQPFAIDSTTGKLTVSGLLDFETTPSYNIDVIASDGSLQKTLAITIDIDNVIENNQEFVGITLSALGGPFPGETDLNIIGVAADPDGDGHANIFELWRGTDPDSADQPPAAVLEEFLFAGLNRGSISLAVDLAMDNALAIDVEITHDLITWRDISSNRQVLGQIGGTRFLRFYDSIALSADKRFFIRFIGDPAAAP